MKKLFIVAGLLLHSITSFGQNPSWILAPNYYNEVLVPNIQTLPIASVANGNTTNSPLDGYDGAAASGGQNIISDQQNKIVFFIIDQYIYDSKGRLIDVFSARSEDGTYMEATGLISEIAIVPVPEDCNSFYLLSTAENPNAGVSFAEGYVSKLTVNYDGAGNLLPGSGLEVVDIFNCAIKGVSFKELIGPDYNAVNNVHDERPLIAISQKNSIGDQFVFVQNGARVFRLKVGSNAITFDNYFLDLHTIFPGRLFLPVTRFREEMEIIQLNSGNYRIAFPQEYTVISTGIDYKSIVVFDLDNTGILIANSQRCIDYINDNSILPDDKLLIKGIELSPDGSKLYVAHNKQGIYQSSLDYFDLNIASPSPIVISALNLFALSQIESIVDNSSANGYAILIPSQNNIAKISNSDNPTFPADLSYTYLSVVNNATNPFPADVLSLNTAHSLRLLQDQIDYSDYSFIDPNVYDEDTYDATVNATWVANPSGPGTGNPIIYDNGSIAYIKNELRIKAGTTITISGLTIHFAPGARLVIENGEGGQQGGKLILNNTILTNENRCDKDKMWLGVEVWGNQELSQGTISSSTQGRLIMLNNSRIEHAQIGVLLSKRNSYIEPIPVLPGSCLDNILPQFVSIVLPFSFSDTYNGGVIQTTASQFLGNQRGVWMRKYLATSGANNLSFIRNTDFIWNGLLKENLSLQAHITFDVVKGIQIKGSDFLNNTPNLFSVANQGIGILSRQSQFYVSPYCTSIGPIGVPCPVANTIKSTFLDLRYGIHVTNSDAFTYSVDQSIFDNCVYGIYNIGTDNERITSNIFKVREANYFTAGGAIYNSTGYKIQENEFFEKDDISINNGDGISYGLVINSSGTSHNEVYNNDFHNLRVGGQSEKINGTTVINPNDPLATGLQWKCNNFYNQIYLADLGVNGIIDYHQGYLGSTSLNGAVLVSA